MSESVDDIPEIEVVEEIPEIQAEIEGYNQRNDDEDSHDGGRATTSTSPLVAEKRCGDGANTLGKRLKTSHEETQSGKCWVWKYFAKLKQPLQKAKCLLCEEVLSCKSTTSLKYHLKAKHNRDPPEKLNNKQATRESVKGLKADSRPSSQQLQQPTLPSFGNFRPVTEAFSRKTSKVCKLYTKYDNLV